jgi:hypothetical protein
MSTSKVSLADVAKVASVNSEIEASEVHEDVSDEVAVEKQAEQSKAHGIWSAVKDADLDEVDFLLKANEKLYFVRGPVGETILHLCYLYNSPAHKKLARWLLEKQPSLINTVYEAHPYRGENVLHMAIANCDLEEARFIYSICPKLIIGRAIGGFFSIDGSAYYGEYPLGFAVCTNQADAVKFLVVDCGVSLLLQDRNGNTVLHMAVIHERKAMYSLLLDLWEKGYGRPKYLGTNVAVVDVLNNDGYSPIVLAAALGKVEMFSHAWDRSSETQWSWGAISAKLYPLGPIDEVSGLIEKKHEADAAKKRKDIFEQRNVGGDKKNSTFRRISFYLRMAALEALKNDFKLLQQVSKTDELPQFSSLSEGRALLRAKRIQDEEKQVKFNVIPPEVKKDVKRVNVFKLLTISDVSQGILMLPRMQQLLEKKWTRFAYPRFLSRMYFTIFFLTCYTFSTILRSMIAENIPNQVWRMNPVCISSANEELGAFLCQLVTFSQFFTMILAIYKLYRDVTRIQRMGLPSMFHAAGATLIELVLATASSVFISVAIAIDIVNGHLMPETRSFHAIASVLGWGSMSYYLLGFRLTGPFIVMVLQMIIGDIRKFGVVLLIVFAAFAQAFFILHEHQGVQGFVDSLKDTFNLMFSPELPESESPMIHGFYLIYVVLVPVLLLNLLVALFGLTFSNICEHSDSQFEIERARITLSVEADMTIEERLDDRCKYWVMSNGKPYIYVEEKDENIFASREENVENMISTLKDLPSKMQI